MGIALYRLGHIPLHLSKTVQAASHIGAYFSVKSAHCDPDLGCC